ncbi:hypothetical protein [Paenibacillus gorillae]|uniref:hypothetical protein n=1 Tax=Paenibacillus gorillae TaxID=1243662 RepID=UPI0005A7C799|nr:hypothetical protein [Paenibacillus gorillae]
MTGVRHLYIAKENKVFRIPQSRKTPKKYSEELALQEVLEVLMYYEIKARKPSKLLMIEFDRFTLDSTGQYQSTEKKSREMYNFLHFGCLTPEKIAQKEGLTIFPIPPNLPTKDEKEALYKYLEENSAVLFRDAPIVMESRIRALKEKHREYVDLIKKSKSINVKKCNFFINQNSSNK